MSGNEVLPSWNESAAKSTIVAFVEQTVAGAVPVEERVAVFDADGTLWCEQPLPVEADFLLRRLAEQAEADPTLRDRQPWKAAHDHDNGWLGAAVTEHYAGDDTKAKTLLGAIAGGLLTFLVGTVRILQLRRAAKKNFAEQEGVNLTYLPFIVRALCDSLHEAFVPPRDRHERLIAEIFAEVLCLPVCDEFVQDWLALAFESAFGFASVGLEKADFLEPEAVVQLGYPPARID